jgi:ankyrin repeat protein
LDIVKLLIQHGGDPRKHGVKKEPPFHVAIENGSKEMVGLLIENGADVNQVFNGTRPLYNAMLCNRNEITFLLIKYGENFLKQMEADSTVSSPFHWALYHCNYELCIHLLEISDDIVVDDPGLVWPPLQDKFTWSPLQEAFESGQIRLIELMLEHGADPNKEIGPQRTAIYEAVRRGNIEKIQLLLKYGADINYSVNGKSVMDYPVNTLNVPMIRFLLENDCDPNFYTRKYFETLQVLEQTCFDHERIEGIQNLFKVYLAGWNTENNEIWSKEKQLRIQTFVKLYYGSWLKKIPKPLMLNICNRYSLIFK